MRTNNKMKKTYITPAAECIAFRTENMMALSIVEGGKADGSTPLSNSRVETDWDDDEDL